MERLLSEYNTQFLRGWTFLKFTLIFLSLFIYMKQNAKTNIGYGRFWGMIIMLFLPELSTVRLKHGFS